VIARLLDLFGRTGAADILEEKEKRRLVDRLVRERAYGAASRGSA
jgi:hypothetical protein